MVVSAFIIGFSAGSYTIIKVVANIASGFIDIDYALMEQAIFQYENNIGQCFPPKFNITVP